MNKRRLLAWLMTLVMMFGLMPATALAEVSAGEAGEATPVVSDEKTVSSKDGLVTLTKKAEWVPNEDGVAKITMTVDDTRTDSTESVSTRIVLVIDRSGSMAGDRMDDLKSALTDENGFIDDLFADLTEADDVQVAVVSYSGNASVDCAFTDDTDVLKAAINGLDPEGGTHIQAGIHTAQGLLDAVTAENEIMIVLSDGYPTYAYKPTIDTTDEDLVVDHEEYWIPIIGTVVNHTITSQHKVTGFDYNVRIGNGSDTSFYSQDYEVYCEECEGTVNAKYRAYESLAAPTIAEADNAKGEGTEIYAIAYGADAEDIEDVMQKIAKSNSHCVTSNDATTAFEGICKKVVKTIVATRPTVTDNMMTEGTMGDAEYSFSAITDDDAYPITATKGTVDAKSGKVTWTLTEVGVQSQLTFYVRMDIDGIPENGTYTVQTNNGATLKAGDLELTVPDPELEYTVDIPRYHVTYQHIAKVNSKGETVEPPTKEVPVDETNYVKNQPVTVQNTPVVPDGYVFLGWTNEKDGQPVSGTFNITEDVTLVGNWAAEPSSIEPNETKVNYLVEHYKADATTGEYPAKPTETELIGGTVGATVEAVPKGYEGYEVNYDATGTVTTGTLKALTPTSPKTDVVVLKLYYDPVFTVTYDWGDVYPEGAELPKAEKAKYYLGNTYTVDSEYYKDLTVDIKDAYDNVTATYTFSGWKIDDKVVTGEQTISGNVALKGVWDLETFELDTYNVTYKHIAKVNSKGETVEPPTKEVPVDETNYVKNQPVTVQNTPVVPDGYVFLGWTNEKDGQPVSGTFNITEDVTLIGNWAAEPSNVVVGKTVKYIVQHYRGDVTTGEYPTDPTETELFNGTVGATVEAVPKAYEGYEVNYDAVGTVRTGVLKALTPTSPAADVVVLKLYYDPVFTVTYTDGVEDEKVFDDQVTSGLKLNEETPKYNEGKNPVRADYAFMGWSPAVDDKVTEDATYVAQWAKLPNVSKTVDQAVCKVDETVTYTVTVKNEDTKDHNFVVTDTYFADATEIKVNGTAVKKPADNTLTVSVKAGETATIVYTYVHKVTGTKTNTALVKIDGTKETITKTADVKVGIEPTEMELYGAYKVEYYFEDAEGKYVLDESKTEFPLYGKLGAEVKAEKVFDNYTYNAEESTASGVVIKPEVKDNELTMLVLKLYYDRILSIDVEKEVDGDKSIRRGQWVKYKITVKNTCEFDLTNVVVTEKPDEAVFSEGEFVDLPDGVKFVDGSNDEVKIDKLNVDGTVTLTYKAKVKSNAQKNATLVNTVEVAVPNGPEKEVTCDEGKVYVPKSGGGSSSKKDKEIVAGDVEEILNTEDHFQYVQGYPDGTVGPERNITRAEATVIFFRLLQDHVREGLLTAENNFPDVNLEDWFNLGVSTMEYGDFVSGYEDGYFRPNGNITRAELATIISNFDDLEPVTENRFPDVEGHWAEAYINSAAEKGWLSGYDDGLYRPNQYITRAETMSMINRVLNRRVDAEGLHADAKQWVDNTEGKWYYYAVLEATNHHDYQRADVKDMENWTAINPNKVWEN